MNMNEQRQPHTRSTAIIGTAIAGIDRYQGHKVLSAQWDADHDFQGKRVAVIGTGASAVQIVPELIKTAARVKVFQRTPSWVLPRVDSVLGIAWTSWPTRVVEWAAKRHLHRQVQDPWLRRQLLPQHRLDDEYILLSSDYYPALQQPNCELVTWPIDRLCEEGIRTCDGLIHEFDCIVFATE